LLVEGAVLYKILRLGPEAAVPERFHTATTSFWYHRPEAAVWNREGDLL
jgi:hypothetical protein